jgi:hypothetical protein
MAELLGQRSWPPMSATIENALFAGAMLALGIFMAPERRE